MNDKFDLERFKAGEPAFAHQNALYYIGCRKNGHVVAEEESGGIIGFEPSGLAQLTMKRIIKKVDLSKLPVDTLVETEQGLRYFVAYNNGLMVFSHGRKADEIMKQVDIMTDNLVYGSIVSYLEEISKLRTMIEEVAKGHARYEYVRSLNAREFCTLCHENITSGVPFDHLVDKEIQMEGNVNEN